MIDRSAQAVKAKCLQLKTFWSARDAKMRQWYRLVQMVDELKTEKMESFVGNDARAMYNLVLHVLGTKIPHRLKDYNLEDPEQSSANDSVGKLMEKCWNDAEKQFRKAGPRQDLHRTIRGLMLSTGWYAVFAPFYDDGTRAYADAWNPIEVYPMWDIEMGLSEVSHVFRMAGQTCNLMAKKNQWQGSWKTDQDIFDYWWIEESAEPFASQVVWNAVVVGQELVKYEPTRFSKIPIYTGPVGGLPDTGPLSEGSDMSTQSFNAGGKGAGERWKEEIGQAVIATNENIYRTWNKWWTFSLQLLRDTAQPRIFERSRSGKPIVKPEEVFRRGTIWRGGVDDSVEFIEPPNMPLELRSNQLDLEAMMQRGGVSWSMYGAVQGQMSAYVMSQISASANQVMSPFHEALQNLYSDIDNDWLQDILQRSLHPYKWKRPTGLTSDMEIDASFPIEIPGDMIQRLTAARMADPDFRLSYSYVMDKLFPDVRDPSRERARVLADQAMLNPINGLIAQVQYYRQQANYLSSIGDYKTAELYTLAAEAAQAQLQPQQQQPAEQRGMSTRTEAAPPSMTRSQGEQNAY
jgi:hypothetical protein